MVHAEKKGRQRLSLFEIINILIFVLLGILCVFPYLHLLAKSFSSSAAVNTGSVVIWPIGFHLNNYRHAFTGSNFLNAAVISILVTAIGTAGGLFMTAMCAYSLSKPELPGRKVFLLMFVFSMLFYGGIVPSYFLMRTLGLINTLWAMVLPLVFSTYNMLILKTFFEGIPDSLAESARIDGANNFRIFLSIILPISLPSLATIGLFMAVGYWNNYFHPSMFITKQSLKPLQVFLYEIINSEGDPEQLASLSQTPNVTTGGLQAATIMAATVPILVLYPFLQKYFVKGLTLGSVKG